MRALLLIAATILALSVSGCFNVDEPPCSFSCGPNGECPDDYLCGGDNYCHLHGTGICDYPDGAVAPDQAMSSNDLGPTMDLPFEIETDFSVPADLSAADL